MSFAWVEYLSVAEALVRQRGTLADVEACCRAAISRAYYAAYCAARNHARDVEGLVLTQTGDDHRQCLRHYRQAADVAHQELGELLFRLRRHRTQADYADTMQDAVSRAYAACQGARRVFALLQALR
ncbi:MAG: hypothetical protein HYY20_02185 [Candidatus Tectomicrobia bacterium]|uniref:HEPN domain-containing protein n=1 Tax=Tectimicrobiota bacterium TaxID=2528274 RepID=A0A932CM30_UNCTE|nr:hypothetical protein [Candidatus Tectomicrobia bacterium]